MIFKDGQAGFSLTAILVVLGAVLVIVTQVMFSRAEALKTTEKIAATDSYQAVLEGFTGDLGNEFQAQFAAICQGNTAPLGNLKFSGVTLGFTTHINAPGSLLARVQDLPRRCRTPAFSNTGRQYFCLNVTKDPELPQQAFGGSQYGYVEVAIRATDVWQNEINCARYLSAAPGQAGLQLYYRAYWANTASEHDLKMRNGFYYAIKQ